MSKDTWHIDIGCSNHMAGVIDMFSKLDKSVKSEVNLGNDTKVNVKGKGDISIFDRSGRRIIVENILCSRSQM